MASTTWLLVELLLGLGARGGNLGGGVHYGELGLAILPTGGHRHAEVVKLNLLDECSRVLLELVSRFIDADSVVCDAAEIAIDTLTKGA